MTLRDPFDADVIVAGSGGAGLAAALDSLEQGASVLVVEREDEMGGATAISGGGCFIVATPLQAEKGVDDTTEKALEEWLRWGQGSAHEEWARFYIEKGCDALFHWMAGLGVVWDALNHQEGNSVPRWHHPQGGGKGLWQALYDAAQQRGVARGLTNTAATGLIWEGNAVAGLWVKRQDTGEEEELRCRVLDQAGQPIPSLYAAGELTGMAGGHINGRAGLEGTMLGPSLFSGRVAGAWAANGAGFGEGFAV